MSEYWTECHKCFQERERKAKDAFARVAEMYGKVPMEHYLEARSEAVSEANRELLDTLREDVDIGFDRDGRFSVHYAAKCDRCGFTYSHLEYKDDINLESGGRESIPADLQSAINTLWSEHLVDFVYSIREDEGEGWDGPRVLAWAEAAKTIEKYANAESRPSDQTGE